jgi:hypothetical protein
MVSLLAWIPMLGILLNTMSQPNKSRKRFWPSQGTETSLLWNPAARSKGL